MLSCRVWYLSALVLSDLLHLWIVSSMNFRIFSAITTSNISSVLLCSLSFWYLGYACYILKLSHGVGYSEVLFFSLTFFLFFPPLFSTSVVEFPLTYLQVHWFSLSCTHSMDEPIKNSFYFCHNAFISSTFLSFFFLEFQSRFTLPICSYTHCLLPLPH